MNVTFSNTGYQWPQNNNTLTLTSGNSLHHLQLRHVLTRNIFSVTEVDAVPE
jgi:hypothetical protein